jgi:hypothetical protein
MLSSLFHSFTSFKTTHVLILLCLFSLLTQTYAACCEACKTISRCPQPNPLQVLQCECSLLGGCASCSTVTSPLRVFLIIGIPCFVLFICFPALAFIWWRWSLSRKEPHVGGLIHTVEIETAQYIPPVPSYVDLSDTNLDEPGLEGCTYEPYHEMETFGSFSKHFSDFVK